MVFAILILEELEPAGRHLCEVSQVAVYLFNFCLDAGHQLVGLVLVELQDALHLNLQQTQYIVLCHLSYEGGVVGCQALINMFTDTVDVGSLFEFLIFVNAFLDEYLLQRLEMILLEQFVLADFQLLTDEVFRTIDRVSQYVADGEELRFVVLDDAAVGRDVDFAVGEGIKGIDGLVAGNTGSQMYLYLDAGSSKVLYLSGLDFTFLNSLYDGVL